jgi:hypothetical protein
VFCIDATPYPPVTKIGLTWEQNYLRHSFCSNAPALHDYGWTAKQAGNSEKVLRETYVKSLIKSEAETHFAITV